MPLTMIRPFAASRDIHGTDEFAVQGSGQRPQSVGGIHQDPVGSAQIAFAVSGLRRREGGFALTPLP